MTATKNASFLNSKKTVIVLELISFLILFLTIVSENKSHLSDETFYFEEVKLIHNLGLSVEFLKASKVAVGPLTALVQYIFEPFTNLDVPGIRLVNFFLLILTVLVVSLILRQFLDSKKPYIQALLIIAIPTTWVVSGMALSEIPSMFCLITSILFLLVVVAQKRAIGFSLISLTDGKNIIFRYLIAVIGGLFLGLAILGRQSYLCLYFALPVLCFQCRKDMTSLRVLIIFIISSLILPLFVFIIWGGIVPPYHQRPDYITSGSFSWINGFLSYAYAGVMAGIISPQFLLDFRNKKLLLSIVLFIMSLAFLINSVLNLVIIVPFKSLAQSILPKSIFSIYINLTASILVAFGSIFVLSILRYIWTNRKDCISLFIGFSTLLICSTPFKVVHLFSSRYTATAIPLFLLITDRYNDNEKPFWKIIRISFGALLGFLTLRSFYWSN